MGRRSIHLHVNQIDMFPGEEAHARNSDPETSHEAARKITDQLPALQGIVWEMLRLYGPCTDRKLVTVCRARYGKTESTWRTRRSELVRKGMVEKVGRVDGQSVWNLRKETQT